MRPLGPGDGDAMIALWANAAVTRYLPSGQPLPSDRALAGLHAFVQHWTQHSFGPWAMIEARTDRWLGYCGLRFLPQLDEVELLYAIVPDAWGQGFTGEAARAALHFGFREANLPKIIALAIPENSGSIGVMRHAGLRHEKSACLFGKDVVYYSLTREEYLVAIQGQAT